MSVKSKKELKERQRLLKSIRKNKDDRPELYRVYDFEGIQKVCPGNTNRRPNGQFPIPTEVVIGIGEDRPPMPQMGRMWRTPFYKRPTGADSLYTLEEMRTIFTSDYSIDSEFQAVIVETYGDWGSDGHIDYDITGYKIVLAKDFQQALNEIKDPKYYMLHDVFRGSDGDKYDWVYCKVYNAVMFREVEDGYEYRKAKKEARETSPE